MGLNAAAVQSINTETQIPLQFTSRLAAQDKLQWEMSQLRLQVHQQHKVADGTHGEEDAGFHSGAI